MRLEFLKNKPKIIAAITAHDCSTKCGKVLTIWYPVSLPVTPSRLAVKVHTSFVWQDHWKDYSGLLQLGSYLVIFGTIVSIGYDNIVLITANYLLRPERYSTGHKTIRFSCINFIKREKKRWPELCATIIHPPKLLTIIIIRFWHKESCCNMQSALLPVYTSD